MTRVLVVHHDVDVADIEADELRRAGYEVDLCAGPQGGGFCPVLHGQPCWQVELADVLVYDMWLSGGGRADLTDDLALLHPDKPVVLTSAGAIGLDWIDGESSNPTVMLGAPTRGSLVNAVEAALAARHAAKAGGQAHHPRLAGRRW